MRNKLLDDAREAGFCVSDEGRIHYYYGFNINSQLARFAELQQPQALLSQGEPVGYLRFITNETVKFIPKDNFKLVLKGASPIITSYPDLPVYTVPPLTEALQKDKAELYKALVYENEALKAELTEAQSYKADAERYRWIGVHWDEFILLINNLPPTKIEATIDQAIKENKLTNGETK